MRVRGVSKRGLAAFGGAVRRGPCARDRAAVAPVVAISLLTLLGVGAGWLEEEIELLGHPVRGRGRRMDC